MNPGSDTPASQAPSIFEGPDPDANASDTALDTPPEAQFDRVVALAQVLFDLPITALLLVDRHGKWSKATSDIHGADSAGEVRVCRCATEGDADVIVLDALADPRFANMQPVLRDSNVRFCAGSSLHDAHGRNLGGMCIISPEPCSVFAASGKRKLKCIADIVCLGIELNKHVHRARTAAAEQIRALREANSRIKNSISYATLIAEVRSAEMPTDKLTVVGMAAWRQYTEAGGVLTSSMRSLRERMTADEYKELVAMMPGFAI
jgi:hypothetical protein